MMKTFKLFAVSIIFLSGILFFASCGGSDKNESFYAPVVRDLELILETDPVLHQMVVDVLENQNESSFWHGKTIEDFYQFFNEWLVFNPTPDNARLYMDAFYDFSKSDEGREVVLYESFSNWLYEFMMARGRYMDSKASAEVVPVWMKDPKIDMEDFVIPEGGYQSFNDFFTRELKEGARPIDSPDDPSVFTSPADSTMISTDDHMTADETIEVKGDSLNIKELFGGDELANAFIGGKSVLCMLGTTDYHRFHSPVKGRIVSDAQLAGLYYGMDGGWVNYFYQHRRGYFIFDTPEFGLVGMVTVGMFTISSIEFSKHSGEDVNKGDELGHFAYGGSAILLFFEPNRAEFTVKLDKGPAYIHMGEKMGVSSK